MVQQVTTLGMTRIAVMYQDDGFGKAGLEGAEGADPAQAGVVGGGALRPEHRQRRRRRSADHEVRCAGDHRRLR